MLVLRLSRTGKHTQPSFRLVVQEKTVSPKRKAVEILGYYMPTRNPKIFEVNEERVKHWIKMGAQPSDTVATLLKNRGFAEMAKFIEPRTRQRKSKKEGAKTEAAAVAAA